MHSSLIWLQEKTWQEENRFADIARPGRETAVENSNFCTMEQQVESYAVDCERINTGWQKEDDYSTY